MKTEKKQGSMNNDQLQLKIIECKKDSYITIAGEQKADCFYIIRQGKARILQGITVKETKGLILEPGDFFGIIPVISNHSQLETVQAVTDVSLITVYKSQYANFLYANPDIAINIVNHFSKTLRALGKTLTKNTIKESLSPNQLCLFNSAEYYFANKRLKISFYAYYQYLKLFPKGEHADRAKSRLAGLAGISKEIIEGIKNKNPHRVYEKDTMIFAEGEPGDEMFIIQSGSVKITKIMDNNEILLTIQKAGDIFGEMALLEDKPRDANAVAFEKCRLVAVKKRNFELLLNTQTQFMAKITTLLADRIWLVYKQLDTTYFKNLKARVYNTLLIQLERNRVPLNGTNTYVFNFSEKELYSMIGLAENEGSALLNEIIKEKKIFRGNNTIWIKSPAELARHAEYYRRIDQFASRI